MLELKNVRRAFYGLEVLRGVDFTVAAGGITGLIGPNGAGNPTLQNEIAGRLLELPKRGIVVLLIEHDMGFIAELCDPVIVMAEGRVLAEGSFDVVRDDPRVREAYLGRRAA